jgi:hypothetical protein
MDLSIPIASAGLGDNKAVSAISMVFSGTPASSICRTRCAKRFFAPSCRRPRSSLGSTRGPQSRLALAQRSHLLAVCRKWHFREMRSVYPFTFCFRTRHEKHLSFPVRPFVLVAGTVIGLTSDIVVVAWGSHPGILH